MPDSGGQCSSQPVGEDRAEDGHTDRTTGAYAYHKAGYPEKADAEANALIAKDPHDPYFLEIQGQILLESGKPQEALAPLREATMASGQNALIATTFGHALIATEDKSHLA